LRSDANRRFQLIVQSAVRYGPSSPGREWQETSAERYQCPKQSSRAPAATAVDPSMLVLHARGFWRRPTCRQGRSSLYMGMTIATRRDMGVSACQCQPNTPLLGTSPTRSRCASRNGFHCLAGHAQTLLPDTHSAEWQRHPRSAGVPGPRPIEAAVTCTHLLKVGSGARPRPLHVLPAAAVQ
jgi:hypothetical protein